MSFYLCLAVAMLCVTGTTAVQIINNQHHQHAKHLHPTTNLLEAKSTTNATTGFFGCTSCAAVQVMPQGFAQMCEAVIDRCTDQQYDGAANWLRKSGGSVPSTCKVDGVNIDMWLGM